MKRRTYVLWKIWLRRCFIVLCIIGIGYVLFKTSLFTITSYELIGVPDAYKPAIQSGLQEIATKPLYKVLPSNRTFSFRRREIKRLVLERLPNTASIAITPISFHTLRITVVPYVPLFKADARHAVTEDGTVYTELHDISALPELMIASSTLKILEKNGITKSILTSSSTVSLKDLSQLIIKINSVLFPVSKINIDSSGDIVLYDNRLQSEIKISSLSDINKIWSNLVSAIDTEPLKSKLEEHKGALEYLDARFGNKVFYKFTNSDKPAIIPTTYATSTSSTTPQ